MWYFTWVLGLFAAAIFAVVNAMWLELQQENALVAAKTAPSGNSGTEGDANG